MCPNGLLVCLRIIGLLACADPGSYVRGVQLGRFSFLVDEGRENQNATISGPSSARKRNAISMAFRLRADNGSTLNAG